MNIVKSVIRAVLPILTSVLRNAADKTESQIDDIIVEAVLKAIEEFLADTENDIKFE